MIHLPKNQQGHAGLAAVHLSGGEMGMMTNPIGQAGVHGVEGGSEGGAGNGGFSGFHPGPPGLHVHMATGAAVPAEEGAVGDGAQGRVEGFLAGEVAEDTGEGSEATGEGGITALGERLAGVVLEPLQEDEGGGTGGSGAGICVLCKERMQSSTQPQSAGIAT